MNDLLGLDLDDLRWNHMVVRSIIVFLYAMLLIRVTGMRTFGTKSAFDIVLSITIGGVLSRTITGHYPFFETLLAALTLALCHRLISYLSCFPIIKKITEGEPVCLYENGMLKQGKLRRYSIKEDDIIRALHETGIETLSDVTKIWFEVDGKLSVIKK